MFKLNKFIQTHPTLLLPQYLNEHTLTAVFRSNTDLYQTKRTQNQMHTLHKILNNRQKVSHRSDCQSCKVCAAASRKVGTCNMGKVTHIMSESRLLSI